jgi:hypothetical protein
MSFVMLDCKIKARGVGIRMPLNLQETRMMGVIASQRDHTQSLSNVSPFLNKQSLLNEDAQRVQTPLPNNYTQGT